MQQYLTIDYLIVYAFLFISLVIGLRAGRGIKNIREYAIGDGAYGTAVLIFTFFATNIGGASTIDAASDVFQNGIIGAMAALGVVIQLLIFVALILPHMKHFKDHLTIGDVMGSLYGSYSQIITGILSTLYSFCMIGMELLILGIVSESLLNIPASIGIVVGGLLFIAYTAYGGIHAVTLTDVFQFFILFFVVPIILSVVLGHVGGITNILQNIPLEKLNILSHDKFSFYLTLFLIWSVLPLGLLSPPIFQRMLMAKNTTTLRNQFLIVAGLDPLYRMTIMFIGLGGLILFPYLQAPDLVPHIIKTLLPTGMRGLAIAGMLAVVMSTLDSYLHTAGLLFVHDVLTPILKLRKRNINELMWVKISTFFVGIVSIVIGLKATDVLNLSFGAMRMSGPLLLYPLLAGIIGLKPTKHAFYGASFITIFVFVISTFLLRSNHSHLAMPISIVINAITFMIIHCMVNNGIVTVNRDGTGNRFKYWKFNKKIFISKLKACIPTPSKAIRYSYKRIEKYGAPHMLFGVFVAINFTYPYFMWHSEIAGIHHLMLMLRIVGAFGCGLLIIRERWPKWLEPYFPIYWHTLIMYCLPFMSTFMLLLTHASIEWLINIAVGIILLLLIVDWLSAIILGTLGIGLAFLFYHYFVGEIVLSLDFSSTYLLVYQILFGLLIGFLFARRKQLRYDKIDAEKKEAEKKEQSNLAAYEKAYQERLAVIQELRNGHIDDMPDVMRGIQTLKAQIQEAEANKTAVDLAAWKTLIKDVDKKLTPISFSIVALDHRALNYLRLPEIGPIEMRTLLADLQSQFPNQRIQYLGNTKKATITCGIPQLKTVMQNMTQILSSSVTKTVCIAIEDTVLEYPAPNVKYQHVKRIPAFRFAFTDDPTSIKPVDYTYYVNMRSSVIPAAAGKNSMMLATNHRIVRAHYGYTNVDISQTKDYKYYAYVFPEDLEEVRPKDMNSPAMELGAALVRANDKYPGAQEQEAEFLRELASKTTVNMENVVETLELIKWYHGSVMRRSGEPFYLHPLAVARIVLDWTTDEDVIIGALLHDTVEDTRMLLEQVDMKFGPIVRNIVDCVTHFESYQASFYKLKLSEHENISMLLEKADRRALLVKVADCMHNMRTIDGHKSEEKKRKIAEDTLKFYVPLSLTLNLPQIDIDELRLRSEKVLENR